MGWFAAAALAAVAALAWMAQPWEDARSTLSPLLAALPVEASSLAILAAKSEPRKSCPEGMALIADFCVDRWEAHLERQVDDGYALHPYYQRPSRHAVYEARSRPDVYPQGYISRNEARQACVTAGKRLCRFEEWRQACLGARQHRFSYGDEYEEGRCNQGVAHLLRGLRSLPAGGSTQSYLNHPGLLRHSGALTRTQERSDCVSSEGIYDMVGNLHEWVDDEVTQPLLESLDAEQVERRKQPRRPGNGIFLGGFFSTRDELGPGCLYTTVAHRPRYHDYSTGFRCCRDAE